MKLTIKHGVDGTLTVYQITERPVPPAQAAIMRSSGQIDCGMRQLLQPVRNPETGEELRFYAGEEGMEAAEAAIRRIIEIERAAGRPAERGEVDPSIPCL